MNVLDFLLILAAVWFAVIGYRQGFVVGIMSVIGEWVDFRYTTVTRRTKFRLGKVDDRIHILEGRMTAFLNIDKVIAVIRESDEPREQLMSTFGLTERQVSEHLAQGMRALAAPYFRDVLALAADKPYREILRAWSDIRERLELERDELGRYWIKR